MFVFTTETTQSRLLGNGALTCSGLQIELYLDVEKFSHIVHYFLDLKKKT